MPKQNSERQPMRMPSPLMTRPQNADIPYSTAISTMTAATAPKQRASPTNVSMGYIEQAKPERVEAPNTDDHDQPSTPGGTITKGV